MKKPTIEMIPARRAVCSDTTTELDVLIRIIPPSVETSATRPPLNIGLVLDRSGSMSGEKLVMAQKAAVFAVEQLNPTDYVSVTIFDDEVQTIVPATPATDKQRIIQAIRAVCSGGSTALHDGWVEGGIQVGANLLPERLNRIVLLTDGQANVGKTDPDAICSDVHGLFQRGISTTTLGIGIDYNEDLLEAMAKSGDGNYEFIERTSQLSQIFEKELSGLMATSGHTVSLGIEPQQGAEVVDVFNDLERNSFGRLLLPNLIMGYPINVVARLTVPVRREESDICFARVAWTEPDSGERHVIREVLSLPALDSRSYAALPVDPQVSEQLGMLEAARIRQQAIMEMARGDVMAARSSLRRGRDYVESCMAPSPMASAEISDFDDLDRRLASQDVASASKAAKYQNYSKRRSR